LSAANTTFLGETMTRALRTLGAVAAALLIVCGLAAAATATPRLADPAVDGTPTVGSCYDPTTAESDGASAPRPAVDCTTAHTTQIIAVSTLPAALTWTSAKTDLFAAVSPVCGRALNTVTGGNPLRQVRSQYSWVWFQPTADEQAAGARWFSCHLVVWEDSGLGALPSPLPKLTAHTADSVATCVTKRLDFTTCTDTHAWRSSYAFYAKGKPTKKVINKAANRTCPRHVTSKKWLRSAVDVPGKRFIVVCYSKTAR
jgi:hypothetical protein